MTVQIIPFAADHLQRIRLQSAQSALQAHLADDSVGEGLIGDHAYTALAGDDVVACAGIVPEWPGRAIAWAFFGALPRMGWVVVTRQARATIDAAHRAGHRRIETTVDGAFRAGHRWIRLLGFRPEGILEAYCPRGRDHVLYARVRF